MSRNVNHTALYAVQAAACLAQRPGQRMTAAEIARTLQLPGNYLGKVLHALAHAGLLDSVRGRNGGFCLTRSAKDITLAQVTKPFITEPAARVWWLEAADRTEAFLESTTLQMLVEAGLRSTLNGRLL